MASHVQMLEPKPRSSVRGTPRGKYSRFGLKDRFLRRVNLLGRHKAVWRILGAIFFPKIIPLLFFDLFRGVRIMDRKREIVERLSPFLAGLFSLVMYSGSALLPLVYFSSDKPSAVYSVTEIWVPLGFTFLSFVAFSFWVLIGRDGTEFCLHRRPKEERSFEILPEFTNENAKERWTVLDEFHVQLKEGYALKACHVDRKYGSSIDDQFRNEALEGSFSAGTIATYINTACWLARRESKCWRWLVRLGCFSIAFVQAALPTLFRAYEGDLDDLTSTGWFLAMMAAFIIFTWTYVHMVFLLQTVDTYSVRRLHTKAVTALLFSEEEQHTVEKLNDLPKMDYADWRHVAAWMRIRGFMQAFKRKRFQRAQVHSSLLLLPFLLVSFFMLLQAISTTNNLSELDMSAGSGLLVFDAVLIGGLLFFILCLGASVNDAERAHAALAIKGLYRIAERIACCEDEKEEELPQLEAGMNLLEKLKDDMETAGGSCYVLGVRVEWTVIGGVFLFILSFLIQWMAEKYIG